jgi:hypothetical protein
VVLLCSSLANAQRRPDFSGTWRGDFSQSPPSAFGPPDWKIKQKDHELILEAGGQAFAFRPDGSEQVYVDQSLGDLPNFVRKIRTKAFWDGSILHVERASFAECRTQDT